MRERFYLIVWEKRGKYTTLRGRIEYALFRTSTRYRRWYFIRRETLDEQVMQAADIS